MSETESLPTRGRGPFREYLWTDRDERRDGWLERRALVVVERRPEYRASWCVRGDRRLVAALLRAWRVVIPRAYWQVIYRMWTWGLFEPEEAAACSWRRDFQPFPWRGLRRVRSRAATPETPKEGR